MAEKLKFAFVILLFTLIPTFAIWTPFILRLPQVWGIPLRQEGLETIVANYDGPLYIVVAKTFYNKETIKANYSFPLPVEYYASHLPFFPALIRLGAFVLVYPYAMLILTILSSFLVLWFFYLYINKFVSSKNAILAAAIFAIFPARWLIVRSVGSPEPLFVASIIASIYYFRQKKYWLAAFWGVVAQLTKSPAILLFVAYAGYLLFPTLKKGLKSIEWSAYPIIFIPVSLLFVFFLYQIRTGDFLAYFHSGDNIHLFSPPFQIFNYLSPWVGTFWLEEVIYIYLFGILGLWQLIKNKFYLESWFVGIFFFFTIFIAHRDLARYSLPIFPFIIAAFTNRFDRKEIQIIAAILVIPIFLFSLAYINQNVMPISDWAPLL